MTLQALDPLYAPLRTGLTLADCYFYHSMDVPGIGTVEGEWDLRGKVGQYLGDVDFQGKRALDIGAANGILSFHMEAKGAEVVSFDLSEEYDWDIVPFAGTDHEAQSADRRAHLRKINNGYWLCHAAHKSQARMVHGVAYDIPAVIGPVDVAVFGSILLHLRDPFLALENAARLAQEAIIVADLSPWGRIGSLFRRTPRFMPRGLRSNGINDGWYRLPPLLVREYLAILGFRNQTVTWGHYPYRDRSVPIYTIVARR
jgi:hypothetical protein